MMDLDEIEEALTGQDITGTDAAVALVLLLIGIALYLLTGRLLRRAVARWPQRVVPGEAFDVGISFVQFLVLGVFIAWALTVLGLNVGWLTLLIVAFLVIGGILAKPFIDGLTSSVIVATRSSFSVGDEIEIDGLVGRVKRIQNRSTVLRTRDGRSIHIPHSELVDKTIIIYTAHHERRSSVDVTLELDTDLDAADQVIRDALDGVDAIHRIGSIRAQSFREGVVLSIRFWHDPRIADGNEAIDGAVRALKVAFAQAGIELAPTSSIRIEQT